MKTTSVFTQMLQGEEPCHKLWENERFILILDINPVSVGHCLLIPKREIDYVFDIEASLYREMWDHCRWISATLAKVTGKRIGIAVEGFGVPHAHIHLVPVEKGGDLDPCKAQRASEVELLEMSRIIRNEIGTNNTVEDKDHR